MPWRLAAVALAVVVCALGAGLAAATGLDEFWLALCLVVLLLLAGYLLSGRRDGRRDVLSPLALAAIFYVLGYGGGAVYFWFHPRATGEFAEVVEDLFFAPSRESLILALGAATASLVLFAIGYRLNPLGRLTRGLPTLPRAADLPPLAAVAIPLMVIGWFARISVIQSGRYFHRPTDEVVQTGSTYLTFVGSLLPLLATALVGAYYYLDRERSSDTRLRTVFWTLVAIEAAWVVPTGSRGQVVGLLMMIVVVRYYCLGQVVSRGAMVALTVAIVFVVFPFALYYRNDASDYRREASKALSVAAERTFTQSPEEAAEAGLTAAFTRFADAASLAQAIELGSEAGKRRPGETLRWFSEGFVPRAALKNKVDPGAYGNEFGRDYRFIGSDDFKTSIAVTQPGEMYLNFGYLGLLLMVGVGAVYRVFADYLRERSTSAPALAIYAVLAWPLLSSHETIVANGLAGTLKILFVFTVILMAASFVARTLRRQSGRLADPAHAEAA